MVLLCPLAIKATANKIGASEEPSNGSSNLWASVISAMSNIPLVKKTDAARIKIAALTNKARLSAMAQSIMLNFIAFRIPKTVRSIFRV